MRKKIIAGNWKMNLSLSEGEKLADVIMAEMPATTAEVIIAPSFIHLANVSAKVRGTSIKIAAQNCSQHNAGAYTGEVSAEMIKSSGAYYVIIGHSERRVYFKESNELLLQKINKAIEYKLKVIYCIGENLAQREAGNHFDIVHEQLKAVLFNLSAQATVDTIIAYEPVWAIGTGKTATPEQAQEMHAYIRDTIKTHYNADVANAVRILYGGSCNEQNAASILTLPDVDGGLIGGASLKAESFISIIKAAN